MLSEKITAGGYSKKLAADDCRRVMEIKDKIDVLRIHHLEMDSKTVEGISENERLQYLIYATMVYKDTGKRFFNSFAEFTTSKIDVSEAATAVLNKIYGLDKIEQDDPIEIKTMKRFGLMNEKGQFIKDGHLVDEDGRRINDKGHYLDEDGNRVNKFGQRIDDDGNFIVEFAPL